jgi:hypothetical protein
VEAGAGEVNDPVREHLDKAENWLVLAEGNRSELVSLHEGTGTYTEVEDAQRWYFAIMLESAKDLAELHRAMAQTYWDCTPQRVALDTATPNAARLAALRQALAEKIGPPRTEAEVSDAIRAAAAADVAEHAAVTLRPGTDPEPEGSEGDLWTFAEPDKAAGQWFWYAVNGHASPHPGDQHADRWLMVRHYAQVLRWQGEQGTKSIPWTWPELTRGRGTEEPPVLLRRPTAEERTRFFGPEPDDAPTPPKHVCSQFDSGDSGVNPIKATDLCDRCGASAYAHAGKADNASPEGPIRFDATVEAFSDEAVAEMARAVRREQAKRGLLGIEMDLPPAAVNPWRSPRGGAAQWREG